MVNLLEELKNNFEIIELDSAPPYIQIQDTAWHDTHDKAVKSIIQILKDKGYTEIILPYIPIPYIINNWMGGYKGVISISTDQKKGEIKK